jgi:type II secretory pathway component PulM
MKAGGSLSIWFFIGLSLLVNGALIFATGIYELAFPPRERVILYELHANIWWGGILLVLGIVYCFHFSPSRERARTAGSS